MYRRFLCAGFVLSLALAATACQSKTGYKNEFVATSRGGYQVRAVPDPDAKPAAETSAKDTAPSADDELAAAKVRIKELETQVRVLTDEVNRLSAKSTTVP